MLLRPSRSLTSIVAAIMACLAMFVYASAPQGNHAPNLHSVSTSYSVDDHSHDHGDHSHDDWDIVADDGPDNDHHHGDHTHEKADLGAVPAAGRWPVRELKQLLPQITLSGRPPYGIERPPRSVT